MSPSVLVARGAIRSVALIRRSASAIDAAAIGAIAANRAGRAFVGWGAPASDDPRQGSPTVVENRLRIPIGR
jgi:hypothetical protein